MYTYIHVYMHKYRCMYMYIHVYVCMYVCTFINTCTYVYVYLSGALAEDGALHERRAGRNPRRPRI